MQLLHEKMKVFGKKRIGLDRKQTCEFYKMGKKAHDT